MHAAGFHVKRVVRFAEPLTQLVPSEPCAVIPWTASSPVTLTLLLEGVGTSLVVTGGPSDLARLADKESAPGAKNHSAHQGVLAAGLQGAEASSAPDNVHYKKKGARRISPTSPSVERVIS